MTKEEHVLIESQFKGLAKLFETQLKASEDVICGKVISLQDKFEETKSVVDNHVDWHNSLNRSIAGSTVKYGLIVFALVVVVVVVLGVKEGIITTILTKMIG